MEVLSGYDFLGNPKEPVSSRYRSRMRRKAGIDPELMDAISDVEARSPKQAIELAKSMDSEEHDLVDLSNNSLWYEIITWAKKRVGWEVDYWIFNDTYQSDHEQIRFIMGQGIDLDNLDHDLLLLYSWKALYVTVDQLVHIIMRNWRSDIQYTLPSKPKTQKFYAHWMKVAPAIAETIRKEINGHIDKGALRIHDGLLYVDKSDERYGNTP